MPPTSTLGVIGRSRSMAHLIYETMFFTYTRRLFFHPPVESLIDSNLPLKAFAEWNVVFLFFPMVITFFTHPEVFSDSPFLTRLGYNDVCVGFDTKPAVYVCMLFSQPAIYMFLMHVHWKVIRISYAADHGLTMPQWVVRVLLASDLVLILFACSFVVVFKVTPFETDENGYNWGVWVHTGIFMSIIVARWANLATSYLEHYYLDDSLRRPLPAGAMPFFILQTIISLALPAIVTYEYWVYDQVCAGVPEGTKCSAYVYPVHPYITAGLDYGWFATLPFTALFLPQDKQPVLRMGDDDFKYHKSSLRERESTSSSLV